MQQDKVQLLQIHRFKAIHFSLFEANPQKNLEPEDQRCAVCNFGVVNESKRKFTLAHYRLVKFLKIRLKGREKRLNVRQPKLHHFLDCFLKELNSYNAPNTTAGEAKSLRQTYSKLD